MPLPFLAKHLLAGEACTSMEKNLLHGQVFAKYLARSVDLLCRARIRGLRKKILGWCESALCAILHVISILNCVIKGSVVVLSHRRAILESYVLLTLGAHTQRGLR